jgi:hypothetical protein
MVVYLGLVALVIECAILWRGQRQLFWLWHDATGSFWAAALIAAPGTILHEASHYIFCLILRVPAGSRVGSRVRFFYPQRNEEDGSVVLGSVPHAATDPLRGALIAIAPLLVVPFLLALLCLILTGSLSPEAMLEAPWWALVIWLLVAFSAASAAFPSPGDHIGIIGGFLLIGLSALIVLIIGPSKALAAANGLAILLAVPAACALILLIVGNLLYKHKKKPELNVRDSSVK